MTRRFLQLGVPLATVGLLAGCLDFDAAYGDYCDGGRCAQLDGGSGGGSGGGTGGVGGGGGSGGGTGGGGGSGGGAGGRGGGTGGGGGSGGGGGGSGGGAGGSGGGTGGTGGGGVDPLICDAGLCYVRHYDTPHKDMWSVWQAGPNSVFSGSGGGIVVKWDGTAFTPYQLPLTSGQIYGVSASGPNDYFAYGEPASVIHRWDGASWIPYTGIASAYTGSGVYAPAAGRAFAVSNATIVSAWNGSTWGTAGYDGQWSGKDIHGCDGNTAWIPTSEGKVYLFRADAGLSLAIDGGNPLRGVWCHPVGGVWLVGSGGVVLHAPPDAGFSSFDPGTTASLNSVWVNDNGDVWFAGFGRTLIRFKAFGTGTRTAFNVAPFALATYTDVHGLNDELWVTGIYSSASGDGGAMVQYRVGP